MNDEVSLSSNEISSSTDFIQFSQGQSEKKELRRTRIQEKTDERREIVDQVRGQREIQEMELGWKSMQTMMMMKVMKSLENDNNADDEKFEEMSVRISELEDHQETTNRKLDDIFVLLKEIKDSY